MPAARDRAQRLLEEQSQPAVPAPLDAVVDDLARDEIAVARRAGVGDGDLAAALAQVRHERIGGSGRVYVQGAVGVYVDAEGERALLIGSSLAGTMRGGRGLAGPECYGSARPCPPGRPYVVGVASGPAAWA